MTFDEAVTAVSAMAHRGWRLGLDRMEAFIESAGLSENIGSGGIPKFLHVAGTNGKGSVTATIQSILVAHGVRTGGYFSPFVYDITERIQIDGKNISQELFTRGVEALLPIAESFERSDFGPITEFEFKTALGLWAWREAGCEWVALEVGLGGRLDATNIVTPAASAIVSIGLDHTAILGETYAQIAHEKAGILKSGIPAAIGAMNRESAEEIRRVAYSVGAPVWWVGDAIQYSQNSDGLLSVSINSQANGTATKSHPSHLHKERFGEGASEISPSPNTDLGTGPEGGAGDIVFDNLKLALQGIHQPHNAAVAIATLAAAGFPLEPAKVRIGVRNAYAPGRCERMKYQGVEVILDGAHNTEAAIAFRQWLDGQPGGGPEVWITGMVAGHDPESFYQALQVEGNRVFVAPIDFHRAQSPEGLVRVLTQLHAKATACDSALEALNSAVKAAGPTGRILVTGSFYLVGDIGRLIQASALGRA